MPSAIRKSSASVPPAKYVDPELRRLQKELLQLRESLHPHGRSAARSGSIFNGNWWTKAAKYAPLYNGQRTKLTTLNEEDDNINENMQG
jgi:hypothetical protein